MVDSVSSAPSLFETSLQGMRKAEAQFEAAAGKIARAPAASQPGESGDALDLSAEMVALLSSRDNFMANVEAAKTGDQMQRTLLNMIG